MGGGGGSSGQIGYPLYMEVIHELLLNGAAGTGNTVNMMEAMNAAWTSGNPYAGTTVYDPALDIDIFSTAVNDYHTEINTMSPKNIWESIILKAEGIIDNNILNNSFISTELAASDAVIDDRIVSDILPRFQVGMRDINAVMSSAFVIGKSNIEAFAQRDKNKYAATLRLDSHKNRSAMIDSAVNSMMSFTTARLDFLKMANHYLIESARIKVVMLSEELDQQLKYDASDTLWDLEIFQYGNNMLAAISGRGGASGAQGPSQAAKALGGGLSGASMGAMAGYEVSGSWIGAVVGGVIGAVGGSAASYL